MIRARKGARLPRGRGRAVGRRRPLAAGLRIAAVRSVGVIRAPSGGSLRVGSWPRHGSALPPAPSRWRRPRHSRDQGETGTAAAAGGGARSWVARRAEAPRWSRMRRMTRPSVMKATTRITPLTAGTGERIGLVNPAKELSPSAAKGGQRGGRGVRRRRRATTGPHGAPLNPMGVPPGPES